MEKKENEEIRVTPDALIALVVMEAEKREMAAMPSLEEMNAEFHPSERFQKKMNRLLKKAHRREEWGHIWQPTKKVLVALTTVVTVLACSFMPVKAVQDAVVDTVIQWRDGFMAIVFSKEDGEVYYNLPNQVSLDYIPDGYEMVSEENSQHDHYMAEFVSAEGNWYTVRVVEIGSSQVIGTDNEFTKYYAIEFDGHDAIWGIRENGSNTLVWEDNGLAFEIYGNSDISEFLKIAEGIVVQIGSVDFSS